METVTIDQGIIGRLLNFGTVVLTGTGGSPIPCHGIASPLEFKKRIQEQMAGGQFSPANIQVVVNSPAMRQQMVPKQLPQPQVITEQQAVVATQEARLRAEARRQWLVEQQDKLVRVNAYAVAKLTALPSKANQGLRTIAGEGNEILFRFLQVLALALLSLALATILYFAVAGLRGSGE